MKYLLSLVLLAVAAMGQAGAPAASPSIPVDQENARKAKAVLDQTIQALGGQAYLNIHDFSEEGRTYTFHLGRPSSVGVPYWRFYKFPDKERVEFSKKRDVIEVFNGNKAFEITYKGVREPGPKDLMSWMVGPTYPDYFRRRRYSLDWVLRRWLGEPGVALFYEGQTVAEGKPVEQVTVMDAQNEGATLFVDTETHLPVKRTFSWRDPTDKQRNVEDEVYDNYRKVQGFMTPFTLTRFYNGDMAGQRFLAGASYNQGLSDAKFEAGSTSGQSSPK